MSAQSGPQVTEEAVQSQAWDTFAQCHGHLVTLSLANPESSPSLGLSEALVLRNAKLPISLGFRVTPPNTHTWKVRWGQGS